MSTDKFKINAQPQMISNDSQSQSAVSNIGNSGSNMGDRGGGIFQRSQSMMDRRRSPLPPPRTNKLKNQQTNSQGRHHHASDSEGSNPDSNSLSGESGTTELPKELRPFHNSGGSTRKKGNRRRGSEWEILEGLKDGQRFDNKPEKFAGYLHKKRKWPLKGWHKRYFIVDKGLLVYAKSPADIARGKLHGSVDIGLSIISTKEKRRRMDIDAEEYIYHLKAKTLDAFQMWVEKLKAHRLYRQHLLTYGTRELPLIRPPISAIFDEIDTPNLTRNKIPLTPPETVTRDGSLPRGIKPITTGNVISPGGRLAAWIVDASPTLESTSKELSQLQQNINQLSRILDSLDSCTQLSNSLGDSEASNTEGFSPNVKKDRKKFGLRKKKTSKGSSVDLTSAMSAMAAPNPENASPLSICSFTGITSSPQPITNQQQLSASNNSLANAINSSLPLPTVVTRPHSLPGADHLPMPGTTSGDRIYLGGTPENQLRDDFNILAKDVISNLKCVLLTLLTERDRLKSALDSEAANVSSNQNATLNSMVSSLRNSLTQVVQQNQELRNRIAKVHEVSDLSELSSMGPASEIVTNLQKNEIYSSSCVSASEFYDAEDANSPHHLPKDSNSTDDGRRSDEDEIGDACDLEGPVAQGDASDSSSEGGSLTSEEGSVSSENSEIGNEYNTTHNLTEVGDSTVQCMTGRRTRLPVPRPDTEGLSLWNLLCKNIGKDLSQISMPVALNEPLNMLQRLCEELEYSELLDKAAELNDPYERMICVAAFAVSSYGSSYFRAGNKPFNPLLGETYECIREDKGFKFISEQVSHHPPVSVCHAESKNFLFWQDARIKTKFWGKSMEFQPIGNVNVKLMKHDEHYQWNKVTTCVHNLFSGQRWVDQYGELKIVNLTSGVVCKLTFVKASYWSAKRHEVHGVVVNSDGKVVRKLFGKWSEVLYCGVAPSAKCIWRPGTMPEDYELYYGFTRFAIELNELGPEAPHLPITDTRWRPDQRALERGDLETAEKLKLQLEQNQRERRKEYEIEGVTHEPRWFSKRITESGEEVWEFNGKYWEIRKNPGFANVTFQPLW